MKTNYLFYCILLSVHRRTDDITICLLFIQSCINNVSTDFVCFYMRSNQILYFSVTQLLLGFRQLLFCKTIIVVLWLTLWLALWRTFWFFAAIGIVIRSMDNKISVKFKTNINFILTIPSQNVIRNNKFDIFSPRISKTFPFTS